jgi:hypothetical protein
MRFLAGFSLLVLGCDPGGTGTIGDVGTSTSTDPPDTAGSTPVDPGSVAIAYSFSANMDVPDCASAGVSTLAVTIGTEDGETTIAFPCDDAAIRLSDLDPGSVSIHIVGHMSNADGPFFAGDAVIDVISGAEAPATLILACDENGWDDGCGGA